MATASACSALSVEAWAERDPGNAFPWLVAASRQGSRPSAAASNIENAIAAGDDARHLGRDAMAMLTRAAPANEAPLDRSVRFFESWPPIPSWRCRRASSSITAATPRCARERGQQCERLAAFLTDKGDSYLFAGVGNDRHRPPPRLVGDRLARHKAEQEAFIGALPPDILGAGCDGLARAEAYFADVARYGERGACDSASRPNADALAQPVLRKPAATPLIEMWMPRLTRSMPGSSSRPAR